MEWDHTTIDRKAMELHTYLMDECLGDYVKVLALISIAYLQIGTRYLGDEKFKDSLDHMKTVVDKTSAPGTQNPH